MGGGKRCSLRTIEYRNAPVGIAKLEGDWKIFLKEEG